MTGQNDPFDDLRATGAPIDPDPAFARRLRARVARALDLPRGVTPVTATIETPVPTRPIPAAVPYLAVADPRRAIDWYVDVLDASLVGEPILMPDGSIGHAELRIGDGVLYLGGESPDLGVRAPAPGAAAVSLMLPVHDADVVRGRAIDAGAFGDRRPYDGYGERHAWIVDPFGHRWGLTSPVRDTAAPIAYRPGDLTHISLRWPDQDRAHRFYADVLGWTYLDDGRVDGSTPSVGFWTADRPTAVCTHAVDDLDAAVERVRAAGGAEVEQERAEWGRVARCTDDQGAPFTLHEVAAPASGRTPPANGDGPGDLSYLTLHVRDSAKARAFYGAVLGWTFAPGRHADGWQVTGPAPMTGLAGGYEVATAVPQWIVPDVAAAVEAIRAFGGTATDAEVRPYGVSSDCVDDQGMPFYLTQA